MTLVPISHLGTKLNVSVTKNLDNGLFEVRVGNDSTPVQVAAMCPSSQQSCLVIEFDEADSSIRAVKNVSFTQERLTARVDLVSVTTNTTLNR